MTTQRIVVVGTGWGGYSFLQDIDCEKFDVTVISPEQTSPYTPLLASAACGLFDFSLAEEPVRRTKRRFTFYKAIVEDVNIEQKKCKCRGADSTNEHEFYVSYDTLILAPGCVTNTFGTPGAEEYACFVRNVADAKRVQQRMQQLLELASLPGVSEEEQRGLLHIAIIGGGPTGVEIAAEMSDLFNDYFPALYPQLQGKLSITIYDAASFILGAFEHSLREYAITSFSKRHVSIETGVEIREVTKDCIVTKQQGVIRCGMVIWVTGNKQCMLVDQLGVAKTDHLPRILTDAHLCVLSKDRTPIEGVFALGDAADIDKHSLPTTAEVAVQKAKYLTSVLNDGKPDAFEYQQKTLVAYIGGHDGVVQGKTDWSGPRAWAAWRTKNLFWTRSWRRKVMILANWLMNWLDGRELARA